MLLLNETRKDHLLNGVELALEVCRKDGVLRDIALIDHQAMVVCVPQVNRNAHARVGTLVIATATSKAHHDLCRAVGGASG